MSPSEPPALICEGLLSADEVASLVAHSGARRDRRGSGVLLSAELDPDGPVGDLVTRLIGAVSSLGVSTWGLAEPTTARAKILEYGPGIGMAAHRDDRTGEPATVERLWASTGIVPTAVADEVRDRVVSASVQLSGPGDYEGGRLLVDGLEVPADLGVVCVFPADRVHLVEPVTRGSRLAMAVFCGIASHRRATV